ncbi:MAG: hypothetical protein AAF658_16485, partial [Myxococcota bacterium]
TLLAMRAALIALVVLATLVQGCFGRLSVPTEEELRPTLTKAFTYAQHGRLLSPDDQAILRSELKGPALLLFERLLKNLSSPCTPGDEACGRSKIEELGEIYRAWAGEYPDAFEVRLTSAAGLFFIGQSAKRAGFGGDSAEKLVSDGKQRLLALARDFPEEPMVHGQLAFMKTFEEGKRSEIKAHIAQCLRLDPTTDWCRKLARKY